MDVSKAIGRRRSLRSLSSDPVSEGDIDSLVRAVMLAPSCFNNQPWRSERVRPLRLASSESFFRNKFGEGIKDVRP